MAGDEQPAGLTRALVAALAWPPAMGRGRDRGAHRRQHDITPPACSLQSGCSSRLRLSRAAPFTRCGSARRRLHRCGLRSSRCCLGCPGRSRGSVLTLRREPLRWLVRVTPVIVVAIEAGRGRVGTPARGAGSNATRHRRSLRRMPLRSAPRGASRRSFRAATSLTTDHHAEPAHRRRSAHREQPRAARFRSPTSRPTSQPDYLRRGRDGAIYSIHAPGLAVLVLPAFALGGYLGVTIFLVLISAAGSVLAWRAAYRLTGDAAAAWIGWAAVALSAPFFFRRSQSIPMARRRCSCWCSSPRSSKGIAPGERMLLWSGARRWPRCRGCTRYAALAAAARSRLVARSSGRLAPGGRPAPAGATGRWSDLCCRWPSRPSARLLCSVSSSLIYGTFDPRAPYGVRPISTCRACLSVSGLLLDQQFGLLPNAPIYLLACAGLPALM